MGKQSHCKVRTAFCAFLCSFTAFSRAGPFSSTPLRTACRASVSRATPRSAAFASSSLEIKAAFAAPRSRVRAASCVCSACSSGSASSSAVAAARSRCSFSTRAWSKRLERSAKPLRWVGAA